MCKKLLQGVRRSRAHVELVKNPREASDDNIAFVIVNPEVSKLRPCQLGPVTIWR